MFVLSLLTLIQILPDSDGPLLLSGKKSLLCYGLFCKLQKQAFRLLHQCQIQFVNKQPQCRIAFHHPC
ncbi:Uncharacterised protein [Paraprevotella clara]|uniref:Uncharacterized protein n=1 Tax=Paraprevotella clara TaxID=454154 RepID=A0A6N3BDG1_9BACT